MDGNHYGTGATTPPATETHHSGVQFTVKPIDINPHHLTCSHDDRIIWQGDVNLLNAESLGALAQRIVDEATTPLKYDGVQESLSVMARNAKCDHGASITEQVDKPHLQAVTVRNLLKTYPSLRPPVIHGLLREGETMNIISAPKVGKSWLVTDLALSLATGRKWLDTFATEAGKVLIMDYELHGETSADRIPKVADARYIALNDYGDKIQIANLRGQSASIIDFGKLFAQFEPGELRVVIIDAFYRALPPGVNENDNAAIANVYSIIDQYAIRLGCAFVLVHHSAKGNQSGKAITDVGSGAGSQARASDTHLILRPHEQDDAFVVDASVRSWPPISPQCLRWSFPTFDPTDALDPTALRPERPRKPRATKADPDLTPILTAPQWTAERFAAELVGETPITKDTVIVESQAVGMSIKQAEKLLGSCIDRGMVHTWEYGAKAKRKYATVKQPDAQLVFDEKAGTNRTKRKTK